MIKYRRRHCLTLLILVLIYTFIAYLTAHVHPEDKHDHTEHELIVKINNNKLKKQSLHTIYC